ncbi:adenylate/guanylate cyclase domain-containing protein [Bradyrhizobium sp. BRP22]|uniref:adenylate/guanylate cyclase domain-containing protein n=1 Tax=Bradyrhizobium sp. BRP22 TaxID=2793821 RepID=UPI001CD4100E|nr:adenylate/guanylate cyclase domain-containing protein [Bradyrhizobium sp. BRP22]MCA1456943.1 adenylate/guanylate cyclase domain-containing protein [Bradyrhizobium sp. BRP22]
MQDSATLFDTLRRTADPVVVDAVDDLVQNGRDEELARVNAVAFAAGSGLDEAKVIATLLHASRLGLFEMSWNILCPSCSGILGANATLRSVRKEDYHCAFCGLASEPVLDETVEVSFTVSPRLRRIAAHAPDQLGFWDYHRQVFFGTGVVFPEPDTFAELSRKALLETIELQAGERMILALQLPAQPVIVFDPVTHSAHLIETSGEPTAERRELSMIFMNAPTGVSRVTLSPGPLRLLLDNRTERRVLVGVYATGPELDRLIGDRRPFLSAKRLLTNQTFRDLYRTETLDVEQRLKIMSLTFLFTDLKGSTDLYDRVGDLVAYDLVRSHFQILNEIVASESGAVVKTIGDAVMATFPVPHSAVSAALRMRDSMRQLNVRRGAEELILKIGIHEGPCLAVNLNDRQDYFGQTVNIASRVQALATGDSIFATQAVVQDPESARLISLRGVDAQPQVMSLRGVGERIPIFAIG